MGLTFRTGALVDAIYTDSSNKVGIGTSTLTSGIPLTINVATGNNCNFAFQENSSDKWYVRNITSSNALSFYSVSGSAEVMRLTSTGNVGIGTSSPASGRKLTVAGGAQFTYTDNGGASFNIVPGATGQDGADFNLSYYTGTGYGPLTFTLGGSERMRITSGGGVYAGCTGGINSNINNQFQASNFNGGVAVLAVYNSANFTDAPAISCYKQSSDTSANNRFMQFYSNGQNQPQGGIVGNGANNAQFGSISDVREKENIIDINGSLEKILALRPVSFDWIKTKEHITAGFIAQEVEQVFPEYVIKNMANDGEEERKGLTGGMTGGIISHLVKAIQELSAKVSALENR